MRSPDGEPLSSITFNVNWLPAAGTLMLISGLITMVVLGLRPARALSTFIETLDQLKWAILTVAAVLGLAYVMNQSGQTVTLGLWAAGAGGFFAFLSALIGWLGVAVTGSDTSSNALFGGLQVSAAKEAGLLRDAAGRRQQLRRGARQDDLAAEPRHRRRGGGHWRARRETSSVRCSAGASCSSCSCACSSTSSPPRSSIGWSLD